jgi:outer membrane protein OmpA-like peptidoglycan-associated protein
MLSYENVNFAFDERSFVADLRDTPRVVPAVFRHSLTSTQAHIVLEPLLALRFAGNGSVLLGPRLGASVTSTFQQTESLAEPAVFGSFINTGRVWIDQSGDIPSTPALALALTGALRWSFRLTSSGSMVMLPELSFSYALTPVSQGADWYAHAVRLSIAVGWRPGVEQPLPQKPNESALPPPVVVRRAPDRPKPPKITLQILGVNDDGTTTPDPVIRRREVFIRTLHPMLGNVYFDEGSWQIPERYLRGIDRARRDTLSLGPLEALHGELAIIAARMKSRPQALLRVGGMTANTSRDQGAALAKRRAESVRDKLIELGIEPQRVELIPSSGLFPATRASDSLQKPLATEENQRVEVSCSDFVVMAPITLGTTDVSVQPRRIRIIDTVASSALSAVTSQVQIADQRMPVERTSSAPSGIEDVDIGSLVASSRSSSLEIRISATDTAGQSSTENIAVPIRQQSVEKWRAERSGDLLIERYGLVLFEFNNAGLSDQHRKIIDIIRSRITPQTAVSILGMTDVLGSDEYNRDLSQRRAKEVARALGVTSVTIDARGESAPQFVNDLPEGRASNRTVVVELKTKVP